MKCDSAQFHALNNVDAEHSHWHGACRPSSVSTLSCIVQAICLCVVVALLAPIVSSRTLSQTTYSDADIYNFALNLEYLEVSLKQKRCWSCSAACANQALMLLESILTAACGLT